MSAPTALPPAASSPSPPAPARRRSRHGRVAAVCVGVTATMLVAAFASAPFYRWFCATTGYGGTPMVTTATPAGAPGRAITVDFDTNVFTGLPWVFTPEVSSVRLGLGETTTVTFRIENRSSETTRGVAAFNVAPALAAAHFNKLACFCFSEQELKPGEVIEAPVTFWVDPTLDGDKNVAGLAALTLSYTFFAAPPAAAPTRSAALAEAPRPVP